MPVTSRTRRTVFTRIPARAWYALQLAARGLVILFVIGLIASCDQPRPFHEAAKSSDMARLQKLVEKAKDPRKAINEKDEQGYTVLHWAVLKNNVELVAWLSKNGADVTSLTNVGETPLGLATRHGYLQILIQLIDANTDVSSFGHLLNMAVILAAEHGHLDVIRALLERGADVNGLRDFHAEEHGMSSLYTEPMPLTVAAKNGHREVVKFLIEKGSQTSSAFADLIQRADQPMMEYFLGMGVRPDAQVLISAISRHDPKLILRLLRLASRDDYIHSIRSLVGGRYCNLPPIEIVELLVDYNREAAKEAPALLHAAVCHDIQHGTNVTQFLLSRGISVNARDEYGNTPLHWAAEKGDIDRVRLLLEQGAEVLARSEWGNTPLHRAVPGGYLNVVKLLMEHGAKLEAANEAGTTPLHMAALRGDVSILRHFIERGAMLNIKNRLGHAPLHAAAARGWEDAVSLLIENGANVRATGEEGMAPLHYALAGVYNHFHRESHFPTSEFSAGTSAERLKVIRLLLDKGADVNARTKNSIAPLHYAMVGSYPTNEKYIGPFENSSEQAAAIKLLLTAGADPLARDNADPPSTAMDIARRLNLHAEVISLLESAARQEAPARKKAAVKSQSQQSPQRP